MIDHAACNAALAAAEEKVAALEAERDELQTLLLNMGSYVGSDLFIAAENAVTTESKLSIAVAALERIAADGPFIGSAGHPTNADRAREALERINAHD